MSELPCRACGGPLVEVLDLGRMPLADELYPDPESSLGAERFSLKLGRCSECSWVQLLATPPPERLFAGDYRYYSAVSEGVSNSAKSHAKQLIENCRLDKHSLVLEVASNDGYQLRWFARAGIGVLGIDPARGPAAVARELGIPTVPAFFDAELASGLFEEKGQADVILAKNVLAHVPDPGGFLDGVRRLLKPQGLASFEFPYLGSLLEGQFDTIYHEHASYLAIAPLDRLLRRHGLYIVAIQEIELHGGSLRVDVRHRQDPDNGDRDRFLQMEDHRDLNRLCTLQEFAGRVEQQIKAIRQMVGQLNDQGYRLAAYGAAAKGAMLLNACGLGVREIEFVVDRNQHKLGRFMPGTGIEIRGTESLLSESPDATLILAWNFVDEIRAQQQQYEKRGGRWVIPIPHPRLIGSALPG